MLLTCCFAVASSQGPPGGPPATPCSPTSPARLSSSSSTVLPSATFTKATAVTSAPSAMGPLPPPPPPPPPVGGMGPPAAPPPPPPPAGLSGNYHLVGWHSFYSSKTPGLFQAFLSETPGNPTVAYTIFFHGLEIQPWCLWKPTLYPRPSLRTNIYCSIVLCGLLNFQWLCVLFISLGVSDF